MGRLECGPFSSSDISSSMLVIKHQVVTVFLSIVRVSGSINSYAFPVVL